MPLRVCEIFHAAHCKRFISPSHAIGSWTLETQSSAESVPSIMDSVSLQIPVTNRWADKLVY
jgi:hypothetical protein